MKIFNSFCTCPFQVKSDKCVPAPPSSLTKEIRSIPAECCAFPFLSRQASRTILTAKHSKPMILLTLECSKILLPKRILYDLGFPRKIRDAKKPKQSAAAVPPAAAERPPVRAPMRPFSSTALRTPLEIRYPKPVRGVVAPAPAKLTRGSYSPTAPRMTPMTT